MRAIWHHPRLLAPTALLALLALGGCGGDDWDLRLSFVASPSVLAPGGWVTLNWASYNTANCTADEGWSGSRPASGTERIQLAGSGRRVFRLTCSDGGRIVVSTVEVVVAPS